MQAWTAVPDEVRTNRATHFSEKELKRQVFVSRCCFVFFVMNENLDGEWFGCVFVCPPPPSTVRHGDS